MKRNSPLRDFLVKISTYLGPYMQIVLCFLSAMLIVKVIDYCTSPCGGITILLRGLLFEGWHALWSALLLLPLYLLLNIRWHRIAFWSLSAIYAMTVLAEVGFTIYAHHNGSLIGSELLSRPLQENIDAIVGAVGPLLPIAGTMLIVGLFLLATHCIHKRSLPLWATLTATLCTLLSLPLKTTVDKLYFSPQTDAFITPKVQYFLNDVADYRRYLAIDRTMQAVSYDPVTVEEYLSLHPDWQVADPRYPLQRTDNTPNVLAPFFSADTTAPNIVIILVESLGDEFMGMGIAPFLDSLSQVSLYWKNCLSTTIRSFGAIPAITGSVQGPRGFQFGTMPNHNSLFSTLHHQGYHTSAFYGGYFTFDCIYEYLNAQHIDYLSPFFEEAKQQKHDTISNWWGYHDHHTLRRTYEVMQEQPSPAISLISTLSTHEDLALGNSQRDKHYRNRALQVAQTLATTKAQSVKNNLGRYASMVYTDDCLRHFLHHCQRLPRYRNTIFVITGDHASGLDMKDGLAFHHVPLIIWSPLLTRHQQFAAMVTHLDIAPTLTALLRHHYHLPLPTTTHSLGQALDTTATGSNRTMLIVDYNRELRHLVADGYYYQAPNAWEGEVAYRIGEDLSLGEPTTDPALLKQLRHRLDIEKQLMAYTYYANALTNAPVYSQTASTVVKSIKLDQQIAYRTPSKPPSEIGKKRTKLLQPTVVPCTHGGSRVRVTLTADIFIVDSLWQDEYPELTFQCNNSNTTITSDKIVKYLNAETLHPNSTYRLSISKEFQTDTAHSNRFSIYLSSPQHDNEWKPNTALEIRNGAVVFEEIQ